jgi:hypothetical protein
MVDDVTFEPPAPKPVSAMEAFGSPESFSFSQPSEDDDDKPF